MEIFMLLQSRCISKHLSASILWTNKLFLTFNFRSNIIFMEFFQVSIYTGYICRFMATTLNWTLEHYSLMLEKVASQMIPSSITGLTTIY